MAFNFWFLTTGNGDPFEAHFEQDLDETAEKRLGDFTCWQKKTNKVLIFPVMFLLSVDLTSNMNSIS